MRMLVVAMLVACGSGNSAKPDAAIDTSVDTPVDADTNTDPALQVSCGSNWAGVADAPTQGVTCAAACADHSTIGLAVPCAKAHTTQYDGFQCTAATATAWHNVIGCCLVQPDFAHVSSEPVVFALCD